MWAPEFPEDKPIGLKRVQILPRETFDSSATPKHGEQRAKPKALAPADLERLRLKIAKTIEREKAEDPRGLKRRISELERELKAKPAAAAPPDRQPKVVEKLAVNEAHIRRLEELARRCEIAGERAFNAAAQLGAEAKEISLTSARVPHSLSPHQSAPLQRSGAGRAEAIPPLSPRPAPAGRPRGNGKAHGGVEQRILNALAELEQMERGGPAGRWPPSSPAIRTSRARDS